jgi:hypothetical protein
VVSAPACMRSVTCARFWEGVSEEPSEKRASIQLGVVSASFLHMWKYRSTHYCSKSGFPSQLFSSICRSRDVSCRSASLISHPIPDVWSGAGRNHTASLGDFNIFSLKKRNRPAKPKNVSPWRKFAIMFFSSRWFCTHPKGFENDTMLMISTANSVHLSDRQITRLAAACSRIFDMNRLIWSSKRGSHCFFK